MSNKFEDITIKIPTYYFLDDIIKIKNFDPNNIKICKNIHTAHTKTPCKNILIYYI